ncbi:uncharacterized protein K02A2.6-like [Coccinella septempunctata]|uniref:uncharacterized protein K02A2.6-like n=1 Tax=Coccinella septempunctata TaxID=41139 RepID=UPI001D09335D|nr:uncharacterized protein K02A2.6-like [Coccinella septempunctata]
MPEKYNIKIDRNVSPAVHAARLEAIEKMGIAKLVAGVEKEESTEEFADSFQDNGPSFDSVEFNTFTKNNGIRHLFSPPNHPSSNGAAENSVKTFKRALVKAFSEGLDVNVFISRFLFDYRNTEHCTTGSSPSQLMFGRKLKRRLDLLLPKRNEQYDDKKLKQIEQ